MPEGKGGVCYKQGLVVNENFQMCDVTNRKILDLLKEQKPQVTFTCNAERKECSFQCKYGPRLEYHLLIIPSLGRPKGVFLLFLGHL
jgi:hypothetical protein